MKLTPALQTGQIVYVVPLRNARFHFPKEDWRKPHEGTVTKVGRQYAEVSIAIGVQTRFRLSDLKCCDKDQNSDYAIFTTKADAEYAIAKADGILALRKAVLNAKPTDFDSLSLAEITSIVDRITGKESS